jgi:O-antigen/teichoic acid export membrane protein
LFWFLSALDALVSLPYTFQQYRPLGSRAEHAGSVLIHGCLLSLLITAVLATSALGLSFYGASAEVMAVIWALAAAMPFALLREFCRRFAFAQLQVNNALMLDVSVAATQLVLVSFLIWTEQLSAVTTLAAIGIACALGAAAWFYRARESFLIRWDQVFNALRHSWNLGRWFLAMRLTSTMGAQSIWWLLALIAGISMTGLYAACDSIAGLANPLILGFGNIINARAASAFEKGGILSLRREVAQNVLLIGASLTFYCAVILIYGEDLLVLLYGEQYAGHGHVMTILAFSILTMGLGLPAASALTSMGHARDAFLIGLLGDVLSLILVLSLVPEWGVQGAAYALFGGNFIRAALWSTSFLRHSQVSQIDLERSAHCRIFPKDCRSRSAA